MKVTYHPIGIAVMLGRVAAISFVALTLFSGPRVGTRLFYAGLALYALGYLVVMVSLTTSVRRPT
jgi:hypothetical protein